jgi:hypothetical protein
MKMRYCRTVFVSRTGGPKVEIDFGFYSRSQKNDTLIQLRESYSDHNWQKYYAIDAPNWDNRTEGVDVS